MIKKYLSGLFFCLLSFLSVFSQNEYTISGYIKDASNGEGMFTANVLCQGLSKGATSNIYGFYSLTLPEGKHALEVSYLGYETKTIEVDLSKDLTLDIELEEKKEQLDEVVISEERADANVTNNEMSLVKMDQKIIKEIPAFMGEVDLIKAMQMMPGVQMTSEGSSSFTVRGGSKDQNLILLDEAIVYNPSHLMGFFSVFNNDAIKDITLYKGDMPSEYGGRLSSILDVRMKEGNSKKFEGNGGIGTISSRLTLEGPIVEDEISYIISGRRTYADIFLVFAPEEDLRNTSLYFYDFTAKVNAKLDENNKVFFSSYFGRDVLGMEDFGINWGNQTFTLRWNHLFSSKLFSNFTLVRSSYNYYLGNTIDDAIAFDWTSQNIDNAFKGDFSYFLNSDNTIKFGFSSIFHELDPGSAEGTTEQSLFGEFVVPKSYSFENAVYLGNEQNIAEVLTLKYGLRFSSFHNLGEGWLYDYDDNYNVFDSTYYGPGNFFNSYYGLEPRIGAKYLITPESSIKASYSRTNQYLHLASNSTSGIPLDIWFPSTPNIEPQVADQYALGYFRNFFDNSLETSVEVFYKDVNKLIDFKDHANLILNKFVEGEVRVGEGQAYGTELMVKYSTSKYMGWIAYTFSRTERTIPEINNGDAFLATYDRPHDVSVVFSYYFTERISLSANWLYMTGNAVTFPTGSYYYENQFIPVFTDRNTYRMPDYHRMDLALTIKEDQSEDELWYGEWVFSIYNVYNRKNAWVISWEIDEKTGEVSFEKFYLFPIIPAVSYNFHF